MWSGAFLTHSEICGVPAQSDWNRWIANDRAPDARPGRGAVDGSGFELGVDDLHLLRQCGFDHLALTLEWARLEPSQGTHVQAEVEGLRQLLEGAAAEGFAVSGCLIDGTLPGWFAVDEHGFGDDRSRTLLWPRHVEWIGETFGDLVAEWIPHREPLHLALRGNLLGMAPPGRADAEQAGKAIRAAVLAEGEAWRVLRGSSPVTTCQTARLIQPAADDVRAAPHAHFVQGLLTDSWRGALVDGVLRIPDLPSVQVPHLREAFDGVSLQLRPPVRIDGDGGWSPSDPGFLQEGLATALHDHAQMLGDRSLFVGIDLAPVDDDGQAQVEHVQALRAEAIDAGASGWWQTSPIDGWHWERGFDDRGGVFTADRTPREAATVFTV